MSVSIHNVDKVKRSFISEVLREKRLTNFLLYQIMHLSFTKETPPVFSARFTGVPQSLQLHYGGFLCISLHFKIHSCTLWRLSLHIFTFWAHMLNICLPSLNLIICGSSLHHAIKPSDSSWIPLVHASLKSCVMLAERSEQWSSTTSLHSAPWKMFTSGNYLPSETEGESPKCLNDKRRLHEVKFGS